MQMEWDYVGAVVFSGLVIVFLGLVLLIAAVKIMGWVFDALKKPKNTEKSVKQEASAAKAESVPAPQAAPAAANGISDEIIAVIAAAVAAIGASEGKQLAIKSVRKTGASGRRGRNPWASAAASENTRSF
ncbi:MAG: OadG family protein [Huintestinicola sp.]